MFRFVARSKTEQSLFAASLKLEALWIVLRREDDERKPTTLKQNVTSLLMLEALSKLAYPCRASDRFVVADAEWDYSRRYLEGQNLDKLDFA